MLVETFRFEKSFVKSARKKAIVGFDENCPPANLEGAVDFFE
ncbi:unnamed protein product, partial [marine sediment metagenome]